MKQAEWNDISWGTSENQIAHLKSFKISQNLKTEEQENQATGNKTIVKSLEPEVLNITYSTGFAIGLDSRGEFEMLKKCAGMQDNFLLNGKQVSKNKFTLNEIQLSNTVLDNSGRILAGELSLSFQSDDKTSSKGGKVTKTKTTTAKKKSSFSLTPEDYAKARALVK